MTSYTRILLFASFVLCCNLIFVLGAATNNTVVTPETVKNILENVKNTDEFIKDCNKSHPVNNDVFPKNTNNLQTVLEKIQEQKNAQCLIKCISTKLEITNEDGNILRPGMISYLYAGAASNHTGNVTAVSTNITVADVQLYDDIISECEPDNKDNKDDPCVKVYTVITCLTKEDSVTTVNPLSSTTTSKP